jgi:hypothetical protein
VGIVENLAGKVGTAEGGELLLRPWAARNAAFDPLNGSLDAFGFCRNLFFGQQAYQVDCAYVQERGGPHYQLDLRGQPAELGELKLTGKFIKRMVLTGPKFTVVLDAPAAVVKIPVGSYGPGRVQLEQGGAQAHREPERYNPSASANTTVVSASRAALLTAGGPLTNLVTVNRHGRTLNLGYRLVGADGESYQLVGARRQPEFVAYRGGKKIGSGKFEFG